MNGGRGGRNKTRLDRSSRQEATRHSRYSTSVKSDGPVIRAEALRVVICGITFVSLVTVKLLVPDGLSSVRNTLGDWLTRDADFVSAFSAIGHAVSGESNAKESLEDVYIAVFGSQKQDAVEVSGTAKNSNDFPVTTDRPSSESEPVPTDSKPLPELARAEQCVLGFSYTAPLEGEITSGFGWRDHPVSGRESFHYGVDIAADEGSDVQCFADGTVGAVAESAELGKYLTVQHENGISTLYAHCSSIDAAPGEKVEKGKTIAAVGCTGNATGPHLHFEIHDGEVYLDPTYYLY